MCEMIEDAYFIGHKSVSFTTCSYSTLSLILTLGFCENIVTGMFVLDQCNNYIMLNLISYL